MHQEVDFVVVQGAEAVEVLVEIVVVVVENLVVHRMEINLGKFEKHLFNVLLIT